MQTDVQAGALSPEAVNGAVANAAQWAVWMREGRVAQSATFCCWLPLMPDGACLRRRSRVSVQPCNTSLCSSTSTLATCTGRRMLLLTGVTCAKQ